MAFRDLSSGSSVSLEASNFMVLAQNANEEWRQTEGGNFVPTQNNPEQTPNTSKTWTIGGHSIRLDEENTNRGVSRRILRWSFLCLIFEQIGRKKVFFTLTTSETQVKNPIRQDRRIEQFHVWFRRDHVGTVRMTPNGPHFCANLILFCALKVFFSVAKNAIFENLFRLF